MRRETAGVSLTSTVAKATLLQPRGPMHASAPGAVQRDSQRPDSVDVQRLVELQRTAGNAAVSRWIASLSVPVQRDHKKKAKAKPKPKPKPKPTLQVTIDDKGKVHTDDAAATLIGFTDASGKVFVEKPKDNATATFYKADDSPITLTRLHQVDLALTGADGVAVVTFEPATTVALLTDAEAGPVVDAGGKPLEAAAMPASIAAKMKAEVRLELSNGSVWVLMTFPDGSLQWVAPNHSKAEYAKAEQEITDEAANLPDTMKDDFADVLRMVSVVRVIEGSFGSTSGKSDNTASLGVFQWGMRKNQSADAGSLGVFFKTLKERATGAMATKADKRTDEDNLYINAWKQCTDAGLEVVTKGSKIQLTLNGKLATGKDVESTMKGAMAKDDLRTYQLVAALDWINEMKAMVVMPGAYGKRYVGNAYRSSGAKQVTLKSARRSLVLTMPSAHLTVGDACGSEKALAVIADLLPNRPAYVQTAVWRAESPADAETQITALLAAIEAAQPAPAPPPAPPGKKKKKKAAAPAVPSITESTVVDKKSFQAIQGLLWPSTAADDDTLISTFEASAVELYKSEKAQKGASSYKNRARRLATAHVVNW